MRILQISQREFKLLRTSVADCEYEQAEIFFADLTSAVQYGLLEGVVKSINSVPDKHGYLVKLALPHELTSSYGVELTSHAYLESSARIITRPRRLLTRFTDKTPL